MKVNFKITKHKFDWKAFIGWLIFIGGNRDGLYLKWVIMKVDTERMAVKIMQLNIELIKIQALHYLF